MTEALIRLRSVSKDYESGAGVVRALRAIDLEIGRGEFVAIVGTSGSGKSTLMNILGCLDRPTRGTYELAGFDVGSRSSDARAILRNRLIGFIFQGFNLLPRTTAFENVELPLVYRGIGAGDRRRRAMESLGAVGLGDRVHHAPNELSGGQQQRVAIARALVTRPPMLLADEPTGNLDTRTSLEVLALLQRLNSERGITIVLVTHEPDIAACASRVVTFRDGRIRSDVKNESPLDAASELRRMTQESVAPSSERGETSIEVTTKKQLGAPVPASLYAVMAAAGLAGLALGGAYNRFILDASTLVPPLAFAFVLEALAASWYGHKRFGRALTADQRARVALFYTLTLALLAALPTALGWMPWSKRLLDRLEGLSSSGVVAALFVTMLALVAVALARFLVLALIAPLVGGAQKKRAA